MSGIIRVLIVDDHPVVRLGLVAITRSQPDLSVVGEAESGQGAIDLFEKHRPDVTLMDLRLPGMSGLEAIRRIRANVAHARFIVLTSYSGDEDIHEAIQVGAQGYLMKGMSHETLIDALRTVHDGRKYFPPQVRDSIADRTPNSDLTPREREVLRLIAQGKSNKAIASALGITEGTVKCHINVILSRLGVMDRTQALIVALQRGFVHIA